MESKLKTCTKCMELKDVSQFYKNGRQGRRPDCNVCTGKRNNAFKKKYKEKHVAQVKKWQKLNPDKMRKYYLKREYGLTIQEYEKMLSSQNGACKICLKEDKLFVDHCHSTLKVRGLLCNMCNSAIGMIGENIESLYRAIEYLKAKV